MLTYERVLQLDPAGVGMVLDVLGETGTFRALSEGGLARLLGRSDLLAPGCWAACDAGGVAGLALATTGETAATLHLIAVRREARRRGIGRELAARVAADARARGLQEVRTVSVSTKDEAACAFFDAMGWESEDSGGLRMRRDLRDLASEAPDGIPVAAGYALRTYGDEDAEAWVRVRNAAFATEAHSNEAWTLETFRKSFLSDPVFSPDRVFLAVRASDGEVCGTTSSWDYAVDGRTVGLIHWVAVAPEHRGKRLGVSLMLRALQDMKARGHTEAYLNTNAGLRHAVQLYESLGFRVDERRVRYRHLL